MGKPKAKTMIEQMGFKDKDLNTPLHDEIMFWLDKYVKTEFIKKLEETTYSKLIKKNNELFKNPRSTITVNWVKWEYPIKTEKGYNIGFIDLRLDIDVIKYKKRKDGIYQDTDCDTYYFEVKPELPSIGELIRQINFYKSNIEDRGKFYVVAPKPQKNYDNIKKILNEQGIEFIEYPVKTIKTKKGLDVFTSNKET